MGFCDWPRERIGYYLYQSRLSFKRLPVTHKPATKFMRIVFVLDYFYEEVKGGAELTLQSHIDTCPFPLVRVKSEKFKPSMLRKDDFVVFGNFDKLNKAILPEMVKYRYVVEECDYKFCVYRSSHLHRLMTGKDCDCHKSYSKPIVDFFLGARHLFWKSIRQAEEYYKRFPELKEKPSSVMGGVFTEKQLDFILSLKSIVPDDLYFILKSKSWIKGNKESLLYCIKNRLPFREVGDLPYEQSLRLMAQSKGIVYLPNGFDCSCRMITEMKLLGREIITNDNIQHMTEDWFNSGEAGMIEWLKSRNKVFWKKVNEAIDCPA